MKKQTNKETACLRKTSIGGQALMEGIMMKGPSKTALAVRNPEGKLVIEEFETKGKKRPAICRWPMIRGIFGYIDSMTVGYKCLMRSAEIAGLEDMIEEKPEKKKKSKKKDAELAEPTAETVAEPAAEAEDSAKPAAEAEKKEEKLPAWTMTAIMILSVVFAYITNRKYIFESNNDNISKEIFLFFFFRVLSLGLDMLFMWLFIEMIGMHDLVSKLIVQVIVVVLNYVFSKLLATFSPKCIYHIKASTLSDYSNI